METLDLNCQEAAFPLIIWIAVAIGTLFAAIIISIINVPLDYDIAILGNQGAGKTTLWNAIVRKGSDTKQTIDRENIKQVDVTIKGIKRRINQSYDIAGGDDGVRDYYKDLCQNKTFIIYIYDSSRFNQEKEYQEEVFSRVRTIIYEIQKQESRKYIHIIGSHIDKLTNNETEIKLIRAKQSKEILNASKKEDEKVVLKKDENFMLLNLSNKAEINTYIEEKLFNKES